MLVAGDDGVIIGLWAVYVRAATMTPGRGQPVRALYADPER
jgi:hypothetical protein